jgi:hypothetical protein
MLYMAGWALAAGIIAATVLQLVGALAVREYARFLYLLEEQESVEVILDISQLENGSSRYHTEKGHSVVMPSAKHKK